MDIYKITGLKQGVRNPNRVNVYINDKFAFSLDISQVVDLKIKIGLEISSEQFEELKKAAEFGKMYQRALEWTLLRPRSEKECRDYLRRKFAISSDEIILRLKDRGYLDDYRFAEWYIENRFLKKGISLKRLKMELVKKGVSQDIINEALNRSSRNDREEILKIIVKKRIRYDDEKLINYLCRQGFSYQLVSELVQSYGTD